MARKRDPQTGKQLPEGIHPRVSNVTGAVTYRARISHGPKHRRRYISKSFKHVEAAIAWLLETQIEVNHGTIVNPVQITCREYFRGWFSRKARRVSSSRALTIQSAWEQYAEPAIGPMKLQAVRQQHIQQIVDSLEDLGRASSTITLYLAGWREMFASAVKEGLIKASPCVDIDIAPTAMKERPVWSPAQLKAFLASEEESRLYPLWVLLVGTSCRIGEALALQWQDIDFDAETIWIRRTVTKGDDGRPVTVNRTKSGAEGRVLPLDDWIADTLRGIPRTHERVFADIMDISRYDAVNRELQRACDRAKLPRITAHGLRHATATAMALNGVEESIVQDILGHHSREFTRRIYIHVDLEAKRKGSRSVAQLLGYTETDAA